ncbi:MAG: hypothetical protein IPN71_08180 [Fibrobacteres bacterium]|nr:hypothetical protein [Fibrobacterota bacterium]
MPSMPTSGNPFSGLDMPSMPSLGNPLSGLSAPGLPSLGNPFSGLSLPDFSPPDLPSIGTPGMPGFRFLSFRKSRCRILTWVNGISSPDLIPDWGGDSEESQEEPHKNLRKKGKLKINLHLETDAGIGIPRVAYRITGVNGFTLRRV